MRLQAIRHSIFTIPRTKSKKQEFKMRRLMYPDVYKVMESQEVKR